MRRNIEFKADGVTLKGWLYKANKKRGRAPTIIMAHGFSGVKEMALDKYAEVFAKKGLAVLVYDNRCLGESGGSPRQDIDPVMQMRDYRSAISFAQQQKECDPNKIGIWGTSYTGGVVCAVAALDHRVKCVVSQVPFINGFENVLQSSPLKDQHLLWEMIDQDRANRVKGKSPQYIKMCSLDPNEPHILPGEDTYNYIYQFVNADPNCTWKNKVTIRSIEYLLEYDVSGYMKRISPTPLLMIVSERDTLTPTDVALQHYAMVPGPKELLIIKGNHYEAYMKRFSETSKAAANWFYKCL